MPIVMAEYRCRECGRTWTMPANIPDPVRPERDRDEAAKNEIETLCDRCQQKTRRA